MGVFINFIGDPFTMCICISNHHDVHFKYLKILLVKFNSIKQKNKIKSRKWGTKREREELKHLHSWTLGSMEYWNVMNTY